MNKPINTHPGDRIVFDSAAKEQHSVEEAYYFLWNDPVEQLSMVVRYVLSGHANQAQIWAWFRDRKNPTCDVAIIQQYPLDIVTVSKDRLHMEIGPSGIQEKTFWGEVSSNANKVKWYFDIDPKNIIGINRVPCMEQYDFYPKFASPYCKHTLSGTVTVNGHEYNVSQVHGSDGHYWNTHNLRSWNWGNCVNFKEDTNALFEGISARFNDWSQPSSWMSFYYENQLYTSSVIDSIFFNRELESELDLWRFSAEKENLLFKGEMRTDPKDMILLIHPLPNDQYLYTHISYTADMTLDIYQKKTNNDWEQIKTLTADKTASFEVTKPVRHQKVTRQFEIVTSLST
jgi:hypothetical protein